MKLPKRALYDYELEKYAKKLGIHSFRGIFMRDTLPRQPNTNESAIVNLDISDNPGTHWVAYLKNGNNVQYFDSFGDLKPPKELVSYFGPYVKIMYNSESYQTFNQWNCGHLCLSFLFNKINK